MYTLKSIARRVPALGAAVSMLVASIVPAVFPTGLAFADALNPLTERSLALSSSSPGWSYKDGSENATYAPPNSGANGKKTGNTFSFKVSTDTTASGTNTPVKTFTFQYCTTPAGNTCTNPGNDTTLGTDTATTSDLNVVTATPTEVSSTDFPTIVDTATGNVKAVPGYAGYDNGKPGAGHEAGIGGAGAAVAGNYVVYYNNAGTWTPSSGWTMTASSNNTNSNPSHNFIKLTNGTGQGFTSGQQVKIVFFGTNTNYITNPGAGAFFVRMNTYKDTTTLDDTTILDGGVTVANVMNQSIWIQTKVLETMDFSVGTVDPNTLSSSDGDGSTLSTLQKAYGETTANNNLTKHGICDRILGNITPDQATNVLKLGDQNSESSLATDKTYSTHSFWRLSSNSSGGATVYYSGHTLTNTVGDEIKAMDSKALPIKGSEQFGLALANTPSASPTSTADLRVDYAQEATYENGNDNARSGVTAGVDPSTITDVNGNASWHLPTLYPLTPLADYDSGAGAINSSPTAQFKFVRTSDTIPQPLASENSQVVDCVTGKMRYIANIAATTPAGIYTTKVNYIAAPQY